MKYRRLGKTELQVSAVGIGTWQLAGVWNKNFEQREVDEIFARAAEVGINFIDTAECYGDHLSEQFVGNSIWASRDRWLIATKFGHDHHNGLGDDNYKCEQVLRQLEDSLRALRTDYIDIYQIHSATDEVFSDDELWTMLDKQVQAGKIRFLGNSIGMPRKAAQVKRSQDYGISVIQTIYNAVNRAAEKRVLVAAAQQDLGVVARVPLASGFLSGKYHPGAIFSGLDVRAMRPQEGVDREIAAAHEVLREKPENIAAATWAIAWCLQNEQIGTVIPGIKTLQQLEENALAGDLEL